MGMMVMTMIMMTTAEAAAETAPIAALCMQSTAREVAGRR